MSAQQIDVHGLPALPEPIAFLVCNGSDVRARAWNADQMRAYARAAVESALRQSGEDCGCRQGRGAGGPMIPHTCEKHRADGASSQSGEAVATLPIDVRGQWFDVPIPVHLHVIALREQLACDVSGQPFIRNLLAHTEHCLSAADEGEAYAVSRETLDAMTTIGLMTKVGRGRWAPTEAAEKFVQAARSSTAPPATSGLVEALRKIEPRKQTRFREDDPEGFGNVRGWNACCEAIDAALAAHDAGGGR